MLDQFRVLGCNRTNPDVLRFLGWRTTKWEMSTPSTPETIHLWIIEIMVNLVSPRLYKSALSFSKAACRSTKVPSGIFKSFAVIISDP
jgi:hypothetical protein